MNSNLFKAEDGSALAPARVLGGEPAQIQTDLSWRRVAELAFLARRDKDAIRRRWLAMELTNRLQEMLGVHIPSNAVASPTVVLDGHTFSLRERPRHRRDEPEFDLYVALVCGFCERPNDRVFNSIEELGELLREPTGDCLHCNKPLSARQA